MANAAHIQLVKRGADAINGERAATPNLTLDLSGADLTGLNLERADLSNADLVGATLAGANLAFANLRGARLSGANLGDVTLTDADLRSAQFQNANLQGANLSNSNCTGTNFIDSDFTNVIVTITTNFSNAALIRARISGDVLRRCPLSGANLSQMDISHIDFSGKDLSGATFESTTIDGANLTCANLTRANLGQSKARRANFTGAKLANASMQNADLSEALLIDAILERANLDRAVLNKANIGGGDFYEATLNHCSMQMLEGAYEAHNLLTTTVDAGAEVLYFATVKRSVYERWVDWEMIRIVGRLPLFGVSYAGLILITLYVYALQTYNEKIEAVRAWVSTSVSKESASVILQHLHKELIPESFTILFGSIVSLAIASTIYVFFCPSRIKAFSADQWRYELRHSLVHYWPESWKWRPARIACGCLYVVGGLGALWVLISKLRRVAVVLFLSS